MSRRLVAVTAALVFLGACGSRVKNWPDGALEPTDYFTTSATALASGEEDGGGSDDGTETTATTAKASRRSGSGAAAPTTVAGELPAPAPGTYTYDETTTASGVGREQRRARTEKWAVERSASSVALTQTETEDDEDFSTTTVSNYRVRASALELLKTSVTFEDEEPDICTYDPPAIVVKLPLAVGTKWKAESGCEQDAAEQLEFEVTGTADDVIGGEHVKTFLVRSSDSFDSTDDTTGERTTFTYTDVRHVDPATLLPVVEDLTFDIDGDKTMLHRQLRSLTPT